MSSFVPNLKTFDVARSYLEKAFGKNPSEGYRPIGDVDLFIEKLYNLCEASVHYQYVTSRGGDAPYPPTLEIFTPEWMPQDHECEAFECLKALDCIDYQIEYPRARDGVFEEAYMLLQKAKYNVLKKAIKLDTIKAYKEAPWH
jgi:hypothetical protein